MMPPSAECPRCRGLLVPTQVMLPNGSLAVIRCVNCGFYDDPVMRVNRRADGRRSEPPASQAQPQAVAA